MVLVVSVSGGVSLYRGRRMLSTNKQNVPGIVYPGCSPSPDRLISHPCLGSNFKLLHCCRGRIAICDRGISPRAEKERVVTDAGEVGMILANTACKWRGGCCRFQLVTAFDTDVCLQVSNLPTPLFHCSKVLM